MGLSVYGSFVQGDLAHAATESRRVSLMEMRTRRLASLTSGERRLKDIDLDIEAAARELFDHQKQQEEGLGVYDKGKLPMRWVLLEIHVVRILKNVLWPLPHLVSR